MRKTLLLTALLVAATGAHAEDGTRVGVGVDYASGTFGTGIDTRILQIPLTASVQRGAWSFKASVPWMRVDGASNVVPGLGPVPNSGLIGRGGLLPIGGGMPGAGGDAVAQDSSASGIGDLTLAATYAVPIGGAAGVNLSGNAKIATADESKGLGTGANDVGVAVDAWRNVGRATLFGGAGYTHLGESPYIDVDAVANASAGMSVAAGPARLGAAYAWRESASSLSEERSEITGFVALPGGTHNEVQLYATKGLSDGSANWGAGVSFTAGF
ncbi:transporter [Cognatilysobacter bugurensis]|uniref:Transporter n=1 Tax=Cognatilysobacter bugurensis TaxID=543356 RepID=A0A918W641_9GAMM|nr:transporter [Lysobacter bugurensis]GHA69058.1 hypothetical protein GCM10007067_01200 [Lysobacter bugurensis]